MKVWSKELGIVNEASLIMEEKLDLDKSYTVSRKDYGSKTVSMGELFNTLEFNEAFYYEGNDLGCTYTSKATSFRLWAPTASEASLNLYKEGLGDNLTQSIPMTKDIKGTWVTSVESDLKGMYYTYSVTVNGIKNEAVDPYARTTGANGMRAMVLDLKTTNPEGFLETKKIKWVDKSIYDEGEMMFRVATDDDFNGKSFIKAALKNSKGNFHNKNLLVTEKLFLVFDAKLRGLEKDMSDAWKNYLAKFDSIQQEVPVDQQPKGKARRYSKYLDESKYDF